MAKAYVMACLVPVVPGKLDSGYQLDSISVYSEGSPTQVDGSMFALLYEVEGKTFADAIEEAKKEAMFYGGRRLYEVSRAW